ncbi:pre-rRNA-processing protein TSR1 like protein [Ditylenchus destructor]|nr:pre-rRNA-processing protein TSR1 like protein [Ditylenchus destructor]
MTEKPQAHRPGLFKLPNKKHKTGQHRSKGALARDTKGKLGVKVKSLKQGRVLSKAERKNKLQQIRAHKTDQLQEKQRLQGGPDRAPYLTTVISFDENTPSSEIIAKFLNADPDASSTSKNEWGGSVNLSCSRFKSRYCFVAPNQTSVDAVLNSAKISDVLMFLWPLSDEISEDSELLMSMLLAQGLPTALHMIQGLPANGKQRDGLRKSLTKSMEKWGMAEEKLHNLDTPADAIQLLRSISVIRKNSTVLLQRHAHLLVDRLSFDDIQVKPLNKLKFL